MPACGPRLRREASRQAREMASKRHNHDVVRILETLLEITGR